MKKETNYIIKLADALDVIGNEKGANVLDSITKNEDYMTKPQIAKIHEMAKNLFFMLSDHEQVDDWMESYIAQVEQMLSQVHDRMKYKKEGFASQNIEDDI